MSTSTIITSGSRDKAQNTVSMNIATESDTHLASFLQLTKHDFGSMAFCETKMS